MASTVVGILKSPLCGTCCFGLSTFGVVVCAALSRLFRKEYAYLGEDWKAPGMTHALASENLASAAALYGVFAGLSLVNLYMNYLGRPR